jgi:hypothetical protein
MTPDARARLEALGTVLRAHGLRARMTLDGLHVENPEAPGCCAAHPADVIGVRAREEDGGRPWFFTSWCHPIAEADQISDAVLALKSLLNGEPGVEL